MSNQRVEVSTSDEVRGGNTWRGDMLARARGRGVGQAGHSRALVGALLLHQKVIAERNLGARSDGTVA